MITTLRTDTKRSNMNKILIFFSILLSQWVIAQDLVIFRDGTELQVQLIEINTQQISYKKLSMPDGPTYTIEKGEVFMIKYANGEKEVFEVGAKQALSTNQNGIFQQNPTFVIDTTVGFFGDKTYPFGALRIHYNKLDKVLINDNIYYYGFDFAYLKITNPDLKEHGKQIAENYFPKLNSYFNKTLPVRNIRHWIRKPGLISNQVLFENFNKMNYENLVVDKNYNIAPKDLEKIVKSYVLSETSGVGMVINLINFNRKNGYIIMYVTFFDIASREVLYSVESVGNTSKLNILNYYYPSAVETCFRNNFLLAYKRKWKSDEQIILRRRMR